MSETPLIDEETNTTIEYPADPFADVKAMQDSVAAAQRLSMNEGEKTATTEATPSSEDTDEAQTRLRLTPRGKVAAVTALALTAGAVGSVGYLAAENLPKEPAQTTETVEATVQQGDGLQKIIEEHVPQVASGQMDWRDVANTISHLPQNSELLQPGHILQPGETVTIPVYTSGR
ncbi:MAG TPA: hypothetical protein VN081_01780 [Dongiaceae bacterium]|nr:hypothetical protein [Dongiaceae bacterium]